MKKNDYYIALCVTIFLLTGTFTPISYLFAQDGELSENKWTIKTGFGYYDPMAVGGTGNTFFSELSYALPTGFSVGVGFGLSDVFEEYEETIPLFEGFRSIHNHYTMKFHISRELIIGKSENHIFSLGTGIIYLQYRYAEPEAYLIPLRDETGEIVAHELEVGLNESNRLQDDAGMFIQADYSYMLGKSIGIGLHVETHFLYDIGLSGLIIAPQVTARF